MYRTDKKQHFSEKVTKVESILAADGKTDKVVSEPKAERKAEGVKEGEAKATKEPLTPGTNKGTWASMLKK
jgi:hypothetical protein